MNNIAAYHDITPLSAALPVALRCDCVVSYFTGVVIPMRGNSFESIAEEIRVTLLLSWSALVLSLSLSIVRSPNILQR